MTIKRNPLFNVVMLALIVISLFVLSCRENSVEATYIYNQF